MLEEGKVVRIVEKVGMSLISMNVFEKLNNAQNISKIFVVNFKMMLNRIAGFNLDEEAAKG